MGALFGKERVKSILGKAQDIKKAKTSKNPKSKNFVGSESVTGIPVLQATPQVRTVLGSNGTPLGTRGRS